MTVLQDIQSTISSSEIKYSQSELIDSGNFGSVYLGKVRELPAAIKVLKYSALTPEALETFRNEIEIVKNNSHPNIVRYLGVCAEPEKFIIVMEYVPGGNLEQFIKDKKKHHSLSTKLRIAKEIALGMNWLHNARPQIIHRDLKLTNVLLDNSDSAKICDFGLSEEKYLPFLRDPNTGAKGTPLWMAPEILSLQPFNEKSDVYSFALLLWSLITNQEPFNEFEDFDKFYFAVCKRHKRPTIPKDIIPSLSSLVRTCWATKPEERPTSAEIVQSLHHIMIEIAVDDADGVIFWTENFLDKHSQLWDCFKDLFLNSFVYLPEAPTAEQIKNALPFQLSHFCACNPNNDSVAAEWKERFGAPLAPSNIAQFAQELENKLACFKALLVTQGTETVTLERFGDILEWFGPIKDKNGCVTVLDRVHEVLTNEAFHGDISASMAQELLCSRQPGAFLFRFSSLRGQYTISHLNEHGIPNHQRICFVPGKGFLFEDEYHPSLASLIEAITPVLALTQPCGGSKYRTIFNTKEPLYNYAAGK